VSETKTDTITDAARATAEAWADQCFGGMPGRDVGYGDSPTEGMAMMTLLLAASTVPQGSDTQRAKFIDATTEYIAGRLRQQVAQGRDFGVTMGTDYGPDHEWSDIIKASGIHSGAFPMKSVSWTYADHVCTSFGYGRAPALIWTAPDFVIPDCLAPEYDAATYERTGKACNLMRWHEGQHNNLTDAPPRDW
jgi:hypothetical protein